MFDLAIIGGGIIGLATAYLAQQQYPCWKIAIFDKEPKVAQHQTARNSGVIHSGIYYPSGSLKAQNCLHGYQLLLPFCRQYEIPHRICGKIIVATKPTQLGQLQTLYQRGVDNGLKGIKMLTQAQILQYEPHCAGLAGIHVPQTGVVSFSEVCAKLATIIQEKNGNIHLSAEVKLLRENAYNNCIELVTPSKTYQAKRFVNCAGLYSDTLAATLNLNLPLRIIPFRGEYYHLKPNKTALINNLIYPVPDPEFPFLGVHLTKHIDGSVSAGPSAVWALGREAYHWRHLNLNETINTITWPGFRRMVKQHWRMGLTEMYRSLYKTAFTKAIQQLVPNLQTADLLPAPSGIRAQACDAKGNLLSDFCLLPHRLGIHVLNAPSPAATSCLSIAQTILKNLN